ncbi:hypothetical protein [Paraburkholderia tropica]|uniref:hypothetical protein n=1 Tax=Paraburkholderia tropica TaxID=92647 RepID=UPI0007EDAC64|nr:hypothetical protein [Paraburkholderia tropica]OBR53725.1 hypothetical protein A6456_12390 [Paraburkholderia tropica]
MHPIALPVLLFSAVGIWACLHKLRSLRKQLYTRAFDRPAHATAEEAWAWETATGSKRMAGFWLWLAMAPLGFVFCLALISIVTGATGP